MEILQHITFIGVVSFLTLSIGILVKLIGFPDQVRINYRRKSTKGLSTSFMVLSWLAYALWAFYGALLNNYVLIIGQGLGVLTVSVVLWQIFLYRKNTRAIIEDKSKDIKQSAMQKGIDCIGVGGGCLILNDRQEVLLIRRAGEVRNEAGWWSKPGGGVKFGEKAEEAMVREMKEELDIDVKIVGLLPHTDHIIKTPQNSRPSNFDPLYTGGKNVEHWLALNFIAEIIKGEPKNREPHKCDKIGWFALDNLPEKLTQTTEEPIKNYLAGRFIKL